MVEDITQQTHEPNQGSAQQPVRSKTASKAAIIIVIVVVLIIAVLGIGGYFGWRYLAKKMTKKVEEATTIPSQEVPQALKNLEVIFKYPGSTETKAEHSATLVQTIDTSDIEMETTDIVSDVYYYYMKLASEENYGLGACGISTGASGAFLKIAEKDFTADFDISKGESDSKTKISLDLQIGSFKASADFDYDLGDTDSSSSSSSSTSKSGTPSNSYIISDSDSRVISESELVNLTPWKLKVARNEIYARHGRPFVHKDLQCYFAKQSWYKESSSYSSSMLSSTENKNVATILNYEKKTSSPLLGVDSGC